MSVLIKGLAMPQSCYMCDMQELSGAVGCKHAYDTNNSEWGRALNCPLIELPDHGDLIDRDVVADALDSMTAYHKLGNAYDWVKYDCPAVIPAERSEDEET